MDNTTTTTGIVKRAYRLAQMRHRVRWTYNAAPDDAWKPVERLHDLLMEARAKGDLLTLMDTVAHFDGQAFIDASPYFHNPAGRAELMRQLTSLLARESREDNLPDPDYTFDMLLAICYVGSFDPTGDLLAEDIIIDKSLYAHNPDDPDDTVITNLRAMFHRLAQEADDAMRDARQFVRDIEASF